MSELTRPGLGARGFLFPSSLQTIRAGPGPPVPTPRFQAELPSERRWNLSTMPQTNILTRTVEG